MTSSASLTIRRATHADEAALQRLATLDSSKVPGGDLVLAELDQRLVAAVSLDTGVSIADPFEHTAAIVEALRAQSRPQRRPALRPRLLLGRA